MHFLNQLRRSLIIFLAGVLVLTATACSQPDTTAQSSGQPVPEATEAALDRARSNMSDKAVDENVLSQQSPSQAKRADGTTVAP